MSFPLRAEKLRELVAQHSDDKFERLVLAIYYDDISRPNTECLFEVYEGYQSNLASLDEVPLMVEYGSTDAFPLEADERLGLMITNPVEAQDALDNGWPSLTALMIALSEKRFIVLFIDSMHDWAKSFALEYDVTADFNTVVSK